MKRLRLIEGGRPALVRVEDDALPLARQLALMAGAIGPASREVADELVALLESPRPPRRIA